ncbi:DUF1972 domain-containing protein [Prolixibacteraceae bacterium Z1-6]|uniref:DUF1972 domain-containing protein n=1 Tax=Draconibacterium aestuarii TaxID=2998507 RepID=A0A9X3FAS5_9BACT|nr:DUF1972 domain-containing protein [Prolixibacteraceae bacterium Z1-6]
MRLAIVGTRGIPNNYGGFETLAEYLVNYLSTDIDITVYCSSKDLPTKISEYNGAKLKYIPVSSHGAFGILYDSISLFSAIRKFDKVLFLGFGGGFVMPFIKRYKHKVIVNIGGLDWKRNKWSPLAQKVIKKAEEFLIKYSGQIISDNKGIHDYILNEYGRESSFIAYGGDQAKQMPMTNECKKENPFVKSPYAFIVTRIQEDNNITLMLDAFVDKNTMPLVIVGNWNNSQYGITTKKKYLNKKNVFLMDAIYMQKKLDTLRSNCTLYIHGHSAGGTNPSLVEAMNLGLPILAFSNGYNENTTFNKALYFKNSEELSSLVDSYESLNLDKMKEELKSLANDHYQWEVVARKYHKIINSN